MEYTWLRELLKGMTPEEVSELLPDTLWDIYSACGLHVLIVLLEKLPKVPLYVGDSAVNAEALRPGVPRKKALAALPEKLRYVYRRCGRDVLLSLFKNMPGVELYIGPESLEPARALYVKKRFNGHNIHELALRLGVSSRHVYNIVKQQSRQAARPQPLAYTPRLPF